MSIWSRPSRKSGLSKRRKFVLISIILSVGLWIIQNLTVEQRYLAMLGLATTSYGLTAWALHKDLRGWTWVIDMILPTIFPTMVAFFYFLLPQAAMTRWVVLGMFAVAMYGLLLTTNIFAVAAIRTIQLLRAARAVGFLLSILTSALFYHVVFSLHLPLPVVAGLVLLVSFPILLQGIWAYTLAEKPKSEVGYAAVGSVVIAEFALAVSFWVVDPALSAILLSMVMYEVMGLFQHEVEGRLFERTVQEFIGFAGIVFVVVTVATIIRWLN